MWTYPVTRTVPTAIVEQSKGLTEVSIEKRLSCCRVRVEWRVDRGDIEDETRERRGRKDGMLRRVVRGGNEYEVVGQVVGCLPPSADGDTKTNRSLSPITAHS